MTRIVTINDGYYNDNDSTLVIMILQGTGVSVIFVDLEIHHVNQHR